jgi:hypothetical protein
MAFADGSVASVLYLANGDRAVTKEYFEVFCGGAVARLDDFRILELVRKGKKRTFKSRQDKGHRAELEQTIKAIIQGKPSPIPFEEICEVTATTFQIEGLLRKPLIKVVAENPPEGIEVGSGALLPESS